MRFLADESCDFAVVQALRTAGGTMLTVPVVSPKLGRMKSIVTQAA